MKNRRWRAYATLMVAVVAVFAGCSGAGAAGGGDESPDPSYVSAVDQDNSAAAPNGGIGTPVVQSFVPGQPTSTGADIRAHGTATLTGSYRIGLYTNYDPNNGVSGLVAEGEVLDVPRGTDAQVRWSPVDVTAGQTYYLLIELTDGALLVGSTTVNGYPNGQTLEGGGNLNNAPDIYFITYYADFE